MTKEEVVAGSVTHGYRQQVQSPKFGFDAEVASASAAAAAAALVVNKGSVLLGQFRTCPLGENTIIYVVNV